MKALKLICIFFLVALALTSCHEKKENLHLQLDSFASLRIAAYEVSPKQVKNDVRELLNADGSRSLADIHVRRYYNSDSASYVWVTRDGVSCKADTLLSYLSKVDSIGFSKEYFYFSTISRDLQRVRNIAFDDDVKGKNNINKVYARLEYYLTKAFMRYVEGQRFGFVNPYESFNRLDVRDSDSVRVSYRSLYGAPTRLPDKKFVRRAFGVMASDAVEMGDFLRNSQPENPIYKMYLERLRGNLSTSERRLVLINMERSRWGDGNYPQKHRKFVIINIPSLMLWGHDEGQDIHMRVGVGSLDTKTPILTSFIKRMDFNPQWIIPMSIIKKSICHHAGSAGYFDSHNYFIRERATGKTIPPEEVTSSMLLSGSYSVVQRGGVGNALGRVIFRFDNDYSIYLHDTSNPGVFSRIDRTVSHGCIRVERPYDLAVFMLGDKDEKMMEKMRYSMTVKYDERPSEDSEPIDRSKIVRSIKVSPLVPIYITYYTLYPNRDGKLVQYSDIYGFDDVIYKQLQRYL